MWLDLEVPRAYRIDEILDHRLFVSALPLLLKPSDTIVFSTYGSTANVVRFFVEHELPPDEFVLHERRRTAIYHESSPGGTAWGIQAEPTTLERLATLLGEVSDPVEFCLHIAGYQGRLPIFIFHDAFASDPLYISTRISEDRVAAFSRALRKDYYVHVFPQVEIAPETRAAMNRLHVGMSESEAIAIMQPVTFDWGKNDSALPGVINLSFGVATLQSFSVEIDPNGRISRIIGLYPAERSR